MALDPNFAFDESVIQSHTWVTTITWASPADQDKPGLFEERIALVEEMIHARRHYGPAFVINPTTTKRRFPTQEDAEFYVASVQALATKYGSTIVSATVEEVV